MVASATPVRTRIDRIPARCAATMSASGLSPIATAAAPDTPARSRMAVKIPGSGLPMTRGSLPLAAHRAAMMDPAPGRNPVGVG